MHTFNGKFIDFFYSYSFLLVLFISVFVFYLIYSLSSSSFFYADGLDASKLEVYWTVIPGMILFFLSIPSLVSLYLQDKIGHYLYSGLFHISGRQWYWEIKDDIHNYVSNSVMLNDIKGYLLRNLSVSDSVYICVNTINRFICSSKDVIHSFCIPEFGVKVDCIAGRLNTVNSLPMSSGVYYGQCSEVCGLNHSYMPFVVTVLPENSYLNLFTSILSPSDPIGEVSDKKSG
uniref:Cytochrome c oxidase subunit 2 n=1 Tax=Dugesia ryukyuensis TaxID=79738 RepID=G9M8W8_DUGRY|nr:cytochrome c oxidase subunit II [Dugesia ryukyuensis]